MLLRVLVVMIVIIAMVVEAIVIYFSCNSNSRIEKIWMITATMIFLL